MTMRVFHRTASNAATVSFYALKAIMASNHAYASAFTPMMPSTSASTTPVLFSHGHHHHRHYNRNYNPALLVHACSVSSQKMSVQPHRQRQVRLSSTRTRTLTRIFAKNDNIEEDPDPDTRPEFHILNQNSTKLTGASTLQDLAQMNTNERKQSAVLDDFFAIFESSMDTTSLEMTPKLLILFSNVHENKNTAISIEDIELLKQDMDRILSPKYSSIEDALKELAQKIKTPRKGGRENLHCLTVDIKRGGEGGSEGENENEKKGGFEPRECYFITDGTIKFLHEGLDGRMPGKIFLHDQQGDKFDNKVLVYYSACGSGKTIELAGSSASRGADLGIVVSIGDDSIDSEENKNQCKHDDEDGDGDKRRIEAYSMKLLQTKIKEVVEETPNLKILVDLATDVRPLRINLGIDEASGCPELVRRIIAERDQASDAVVAALFGIDPQDVTEYQTAKVAVSFSVAGTGASNGVAGSNAENFETVEPSARSFIPEICDCFLQGITANLPGHRSELAMTYKRVQDELPVVATVMQNALMASIAAKEIREFYWTIHEEELVDKIVESYMKSTLMQHLFEDGSRKNLIAACALAVHLFQWDKGNPGKPTPGDVVDYQSFMSNMECGVTFDKGVEEEVKLGNQNAMQTIVNQLGLLEPSLTSTKLKPGDNPFNLFVMATSQQLVALKMLGMDLVQMRPGFERLSTHIARCAIAASCVIEEESRPNLQLVLGKIGLGLDSRATSTDVVGKWNALSKYKAFPHWVKENFSKFYIIWTTDMGVGLHMKFGNDSDEVLLHMCDIANSILTSMQNAPSAQHTLQVFTPFAFMNYGIHADQYQKYGTSPFADGFVTFLCGERLDDAFKYTLMIRAKNYYCKRNENAIFSTEKLDEDAENHNHVLLNDIFGVKEHRLLSIAGSREEVFARRKCEPRRFMPYALSTSRKNVAQKENVDQISAHTKI